MPRERKRRWAVVVYMDASAAVDAPPCLLAHSDVPHGQSSIRPLGVARNATKRPACFF
jgi:hypothetical protein